MWRFVGALAVLLATNSAVAAPSSRPKVAVLDLNAQRKIDESLVRMLNELILTSFSDEGFDVFGGSDLRAMLELEGTKQRMGCGDDSCLAEVGAALGVDLLVNAGIGTVGSAYLLNIKMINARRSRVEGRVSKHVTGDEGELVSTIQQAVRGLAEKYFARHPKKRPKVAAAPKASNLSSSKAPPNPLAVDAHVDNETGSSGLWKWVALGSGVAFAAGGAVLGLQAQSAAEERDNATNATAYRDANDRANTMALGANIGIGLGIAGVGTAVLLWLFDGEPSDDAAPVSVLVGERSIAAQVAF